MQEYSAHLLATERFKVIESEDRACITGGAQRECHYHIQHGSPVLDAIVKTEGGSIQLKKIHGIQAEAII